MVTILIFGVLYCFYSFGICFFPFVDVYSLLGFAAELSPIDVVVVLCS
jgi:hypothetical protein